MTVDLPALSRRDERRLRELGRDAGARERDACVVVEGRRLVADTIDRGAPVREVAFDAQRLQSDPELRELASRVVSRGLRASSTSAARFERLSCLRTPPGVIALLDRPGHDPQAILDRPEILLVAGAGLQDPRNAGALARNALAFGADALVLTPDSADVFGPKGVRASAAAVLALPVLRLDAAALLRIARRTGLRLHATDARGDTPLDHAEPTPRSLVLFGGEGTGLPPELLDACDVRLRIPVSSRVQSLNVAAASAVVLYRFRCDDRE